VRGDGTMKKEFSINLLDLVLSLATAIDLVSTVVADHHKRVAYIALRLGEELGLSHEELENLVLAGSLHDIGALSLKERIDTLEFELANSKNHAELGYRFLRQFPLLEGVADIVRYHHVYWEDGKGAKVDGNDVPAASHLIHLADRISVSIDPRRHVLIQAQDIYQKIRENAGRMFVPEYVEAFEKLSAKEYFWMDAASPSIELALRRRIKSDAAKLSLEEMSNLSQVFTRIVDFKSTFTSTHSSGVAATAEALARIMGFSDIECSYMNIAGHLHDLGKLAVPAEILEKPSALSEEEFSVIRGHTFYTRQVLESMGDLGVITEWATAHHERLNGSGYPGHEEHKDLSAGARIISVADVFTALTEDRPYRKGMGKDQALEVLQEMADTSALDSSVVSQLRQNFDEINDARIAAQKVAAKEYDEMVKSLNLS